MPSTFSIMLNLPAPEKASTHPAATASAPRMLSAASDGSFRYTSAYASRFSNVAAPSKNSRHISTENAITGTALPPARCAARKK